MKLAAAINTTNGRTVLGIVVLGLLVAAALLLYPHRSEDQVKTRESEEFSGSVSGTEVPGEQVSSEDVAKLDVEAEPVSRTAEEALVEFSPEKVLNNPVCQQSLGRGPSRGLTVLLLPTPEGSHFAAVDATGVLHTGDLPFWPTRFGVARRPDGSVLTAFGHMSWDVPGSLDRDPPLPVHVFLGDQAIFRHDNILEFGLADNGSSFFVIEPLAGETSRLAIHNLSRGTERHYDISDLYRRQEIGALSASST